MCVMMHTRCHFKRPKLAFFYLVINEVKSGSIRTPLDNVRNQTLTNLLHSFKVQRLNNVHGLFRFKAFRYSFFGTIPNFLNRLLDGLLLVRST